jgi:hypothetical protein
LPPAIALIISPQGILAPPKFLGVLTDLQFENPVRGPPRTGFFVSGLFCICDDSASTHALTLTKETAPAPGRATEAADSGWTTRGGRPAV